MAVESDDDRLAFLSLDDFSVSAVITLSSGAKRNLSGIFEDPRASRSITNNMDVIIPDPNFTCRSSDHSGATEGNSLAIGAQSYVIRGIMNDGTGMSRLLLEEA